LYSLSVKNRNSIPRDCNDDLELQVSILKKKLEIALDNSNYNLLNPRVLKISRELDSMLIKYL